MEAYRERLKYFQKTLSTHEDDLMFADPIIDMPRFKEMCFYGIPDEPGLRQKAWKVLLGYLPPDKRKWPEILVQQRKTYYNWLKDLLVDPGEEPPDLSEDHPLNAAPSSKWATYFADNAILEQIDKDVRRTLPDFSFFQLPVPRSPLNPLSPVMQYDIVHDNSDHEADDEDANSSPPVFNSTSTITPLRRTSVLSSPLTANTLASSTGPLSIQSRPHTRRISRDISPPPQYEILSSPIPTRRSLFKRIAHLNKDFGAREHQAGSYKAAKKRSKFHDALELKVNALKKIQARKPSINGTLSPAPSSSSTPIKRAPPPPSLDLLSSDDSDVESDSETADLHWEAIERILFIYAKLNPGVGYVQGMNELLGPIYYLFATDTSAPDTQAHAEADSFFAFTLLMADVRDHFVRSMDDDVRTGINASMRRVSDRLRWWDEELWSDLTEVKEVKEQYYVFRWITVLGTQEWSLPDVIRLWDSVIADRGRKGPNVTGSAGSPGTEDEEEEAVGAERFEFFTDFCVAMVVCVREQILAGDFSENIKLLQNYPIDDIAIVVQKAYEIRAARAIEAAEAAAAAAAALEASTPESPLTDDPLSILGIPNLRTRSSSSLSSTVAPVSDDDDAAPRKPTLARRLFDSQEVKTVNWDALRKESLDEIFKGLRWGGGNAAAANASNGMGGGINGKLGLYRKVSGGSVARNSSGPRPASVIIPPMQARWSPVVSLGPTTPTSPTFGVDAARDWLFARKRHSAAAVTYRNGVDEEIAAQAISVLAAGGNVPVTEKEQIGAGFNAGYPGALAWAGGLSATAKEQPTGEETRAGRRDSVTSSTSSASAQGGRLAGSLLGRVSKLLGGGGGVEEGEEERFAGYEGEFGGFVISTGGRSGEKEDDERV